MPKITRVFQKIFGRTASAGEIGKFGSLAAGNPETTNDPVAIQSLGNFDAGWASAILGNNSPAIEDVNALAFLSFRQLAYIFQSGIPEWNDETTYYKGSLVNENGKVYESLTDDNINNLTSDTLNWSLVFLPAFKNGILSSKSRPNSSLPEFIRANGANDSVIIEATSTPLSLIINNEKLIVDSDDLISGLNLAPSTNNTCIVTNGEGLYGGEDYSDIEINTVGSEISSRVGQHIALKTPTGEIIYGLLKDTSTISSVKRGFYFDNTGAPINRGALNASDSLTLMNIGYVFMGIDSVSSVSYKTPVFGDSAPSLPSSGDYWFDTSVSSWKVYDGSIWSISNSVLIGQVVMDDTAAIASRSSDLERDFKEKNNIELELYSVTEIASRENSFNLSVYGKDVVVKDTSFVWDISTDLESGVSESNDTVYYLYISDKGEKFISDKKPHWRDDLKGDYHPHESWRMIGMAYNNTSGDIDLIWSEFGENSYISPSSGSFSTTSTLYVNTPLTFNFLTRGRKSQLFYIDSAGVAVAELGGSNGTVGTGSQLAILIDGVAVNQLRNFMQSGTGSLNAINTEPNAHCEIEPARLSVGKSVALVQLARLGNGTAFLNNAILKTREVK